MKKEKIFVKWAGVFVAALFVLSAAPGSVIENVNAEGSYIDVQTSRWTDTGIATANESWLQDDYDAFVEDIETARTGTSNITLICQQLLAVYKEYEFVPQNKDLEDLFDYLEEQYYENQEIIEEYLNESGLESGEYFLCHVDGRVFGPFACFRVPGLYYYISSQTWGGNLDYFSWLTEEADRIYGFGEPFTMVLVIYIGAWAPLLHNGYNALGRLFWGFTFMLLFEIGV